MIKTKTLYKINGFFFSFRIGVYAFLVSIIRPELFEGIKFINRKLKFILEIANTSRSILF